MNLGPENKGHNSRNKQGLVKSLFVLLAIFFLFNPSCAKETEIANEEPNNDSGMLQIFLWPFNHVVQPVLNAAVYPFAKPVQYAFGNGLMEKTVDIITFGPQKNIMVYPIVNLKPGTEAQLGFSYRHRGIFFNRDYLVYQMSYYANGDLYLSTRYSKQQLFGLPLFGAFRYNQYWDSNDTFIIPGTKQDFVQPDSSIILEWRLGAPLVESRKLNIELTFKQKFIDANPPTSTKDSLLDNEVFPIADRGLYQNSVQFPFSVAFVYDDLDYSYAPSSGTRFILSGDYVHIHNYEGVRYSSLYSDKTGGVEVSHKNHDYISNTIVLQHYFYLGRAPQYILSLTEARKNRKFYTDFSLEDALRVWKPENLRETLFERRVIAMQFRMENMWEMEKGGAPFNAFSRLNTRYPLRGYSGAWAAYHLMGLSTEYRWPIDRFVDGVVFDEYGLHAPQINDWSFDRFYNSWGFGIRVRMPNLYLFRAQLGFHGLHGVNLILTIAPEYK